MKKKMREIEEERRGMQVEQRGEVNNKSEKVEKRVWEKKREKILGRI